MNRGRESQVPIPFLLYSPARVLGVPFDFFWSVARSTDIRQAKTLALRVGTATSTGAQLRRCPSSRSVPFISGPIETRKQKKRMRGSHTKGGWERKTEVALQLVWQS